MINSIILTYHDPGSRKERAGKRTAGYDVPWHAENAFARFQQTVSSRVGAKRDVSQTRETALACALRNWIQAQGRPQSYSINEEQRS